MTGSTAPNVQFLSKSPNRELERHARERVELIVGKFHDRIDRVQVQLKEESEGGKTCCSIDARLIPRGTLHVHATEREAYEAINKAMHRLETVVAKAVDRGHHSAATRHAGGGLRGALRNWEVTN